MLEGWMSKPRMQALGGFLAMGGRDVDVMLMGDGEMAFLLWRSMNPLKDPRELNALVQKLYAYAKEFDAADTGISANPNASSDTALADKPA
jgi:hypothetical protein